MSGERTTTSVLKRVNLTLGDDLAEKLERLRQLRGSFGPMLEPDSAEIVRKDRDQRC